MPVTFSHRQLMVGRGMDMLRAHGSFARAASLLIATLVAGCGSDSSRPAPTPTVASATQTPVIAPTATPGTVTPTATTIPATPVAYELVTVGDPGNPSDASGYGAVAYEYRIGQYEVTIGQYAAFLNSVAATDPHGLYTPRMAGDATVAGISRSGSDGSYRYSVTGPSGSAPPGASSGPDRPIAYISWFTAARFANWMANGQPSGAQDETTTEDGAYDLSGATSGDAVARNDVNPNTGTTPVFRIPTEDEWYKAAYYSPSRAGGAAGYYRFATQSDAVPGNLLGGDANQANFIVDVTGYSIYSVTQASNLSSTQNYLNDVGAFGASGSAYGTYDQTGNVWEWNDVDGRRGAFRILRGGAWTSTPPYLVSTVRLGYIPAGVNSNSGFRLAGPAPLLASAQATSASADGNQVLADGALRHSSAGSLPAPAPAQVVVTGSETVALPMVAVGDVGNAADATGFGAVGHEYAIAVYDVTIGQYAEFLNAVGAADEHALYNPSMASDTAIAGIARSGSAGDYRYSVIDNGGSSAQRPITYVSWWDAARFANWMANGQPRGAQDSGTTENGAYGLNGAVSGIAVARNPLNPNTGQPPTYYIPLENEWYKAAYYDGAGGYYGFATQSDDPPGNTIDDEPNRANYFAGGVLATSGGPAQEPDQNYLTDVGAFGGSGSYYGTFDQNGNVWQWNDLDGAPGPSRGLRGGYWFSGSLALEAALFCNDSPSREANDTGFRLGGPAAPQSAP
jgi:formylglycine-generating enzyme